MTRQREPREPGIGDWIVCTRPKLMNRSVTLGGPWTYGKIIKRGVGGWTVKPYAGVPMFVMNDMIVRVCLTRGEAIDLVDALTETQRTYITERDALKPKFEQRIRDLLNA